jgi:IS605 OrfB family transposase
MAGRRAGQVMVRSCRVYLNDLNPGKALILKTFLYLCHAVCQYFVDLFWQRQDFGGQLSDLPTVHRGVERFGITTRLAQALAKQAKETLRSQHRKYKKRKPRLRRHVVTLFYHFVKIEAMRSGFFDWAVCLIGSGAPRLVLPVHSTRLIKRRLQMGWTLAKTIRLGMDGSRLFIDFLFEKDRPALREAGRVVGMDSNYKNGLVFSDGQVIGHALYQRIQQFAKRQRNTHAEIKSLLGQALKQVDFATFKILCIEDLKGVKSGIRGTFSRQLNRRLSHWLYASIARRLEQYCEENGIRLEQKGPYKTSQYCRPCAKWDRRNRRGDRFKCVHCGYSTHADHNAAHNLELLGLAGVYGLRLLQS